MSLRQAAQQALEFLSHDMVAEDWPHQKRKDAVCDALRAALAEPQTTHWEGCEAVHPECRKPEPVAWKTAVQNLTNQCAALIKERDELQKQVWLYEKNGVTCQTYRHTVEQSCSECNVQMKYTAPTPRKPLPEEEIVRLMVGEDRVQLLYAKPDDPYFSEFAQGAIRELVESGRAIERAHGIGEQHE